MNLIKELHLVVRTAYTLVAVLCFAGYTGFSLGVSLQAVGATVFLISLMFEYSTLHPVLKDGIKSKMGRIVFLLIWLLVSGGLIFLSLWNLPTLDNLTHYATDEEFLKDLSWWAALYGVSCGAFVAMACARRAFDSHRKL